MKRFFRLLQPHLARPILYSALLKLALGLCAVLLWWRYMESESRTAGYFLPNGFFFLTVYFLLWVWLQYLVFDGMRPLGKLFVRQESDSPGPNAPFRLKDLLGTIPDAFEGLEEEEKTVCRLCANAIAAVVFLLVYLLSGAAA